MHKVFIFRKSYCDLQRLNLHVKESSYVERIILFYYDSWIILNGVNIFISADLAFGLFIINEIIWTCITAHNYKADCLFIFPCEKCKSAFVEFSFCIFYYWLRCVFQAINQKKLFWYFLIVVSLHNNKLLF